MHNSVLPALMHVLEIKMAAVEITQKLEQWIFVKFLANENIKLPDDWLSAQYGDDEDL